MKAVAALLLLMLPLAPAGDTVAVEVQLSSARVSVGDPVEVTVTARALGANMISVEPLPGSEEPAGDDDADKPQPDLVLRETEALEGIDFLGARTASRTYTAVPFTVGEHAIPVTSIKVVMSDGSERVIASPAISLEVVSVSAEEGGPTEVAGLKALLQREAAAAGTPAWVWLLLALALAVLGTGAVIALNKRRPKRLRRLLELSPAERALRQLKALAISGMIAEGRVKEFYSELSEIARRYLGLRFRILALEMTTAELDAALAGPLDAFDGTRERLTAVLGTADLVKFARLIPDEGLGPDLIDAARLIIAATRDDIPAPKRKEAA